MLLARLVALDEGALECDFAEVYGVYDWRALPARYAATLAAGLRPASRSMMRLRGETLTLEQLLLATIADGSLLRVWQNTVDGQKGENRPQSLLQTLLQEPKAAAEDESFGFESPEAFMAWREAMMGGGADG